MQARVNFMEKGQGAMKALFGVGAYLKRSSIDAVLRELINFRISQINGCAYCLDMHYKDARANGETEQRLYGLSAWHESPYYTDRERAALAFAEAVNKGGANDQEFAAAKATLSEQELIDLTIAVTTISTWNRLNLTFFPFPPGSYQPGKFGQ